MRSTPPLLLLSSLVRLLRRVKNKTGLVWIGLLDEVDGNVFASSLSTRYLIMTNEYYSPNLIWPDFWLHKSNKEPWRKNQASTAFVNAP